MEERPKALNTLAGAAAGGQIAWAFRGMQARARCHKKKPDETKIAGATGFQAAARIEAVRPPATEAKAHRTAEPGEATLRFFACHGPGHEIVKKPFATPEGGEYAS